MNSHDIPVASCLFTASIHCIFTIFGFYFMHLFTWF